MKNLVLINVSTAILSIIMMIPYACSLLVYFNASARQPEMDEIFKESLNTSMIFAIIGFSLLALLIISEVVFGAIMLKKNKGACLTENK